jgi:hypothetical protein
MTFEGEEFAAFHAAEQFATECGFSVGRMQRDEPIGLLFGDYDIQKWRNIHPKDRLKFHGLILGQKRNGPVHVDISEQAPPEAWALWRAAVKARGREVSA